MGVRSTRGRCVATIGLVGVLAAACTGSAKPRGVTQAAAAETLASSTTSGATSTSPSSASTSSSSSVVAEANLAPDLTVAGTATLGRGSRGPAVQAVEQRLADLRFDAGKVDGSWDGATDQAILSFQKQAGLPRTGKADEATRTRLAGAPFGVPMVTEGAEPNRVEVDLERQVLQVWRDNKLLRVIGVSSGTGRKYCATSEKSGKRVCGVAVTPTGMFHFERHVEGLRKSDLGTLYDPVYFTGGYAVHGSPSVPAQPASHGCIRIPMYMSKWFFNNVPVGTQLFVIEKGTPPLPPSSPVTPPTTTTTTTTPTSEPPTTPTTSKPTAPTTATTRPATTTTVPPVTTTQTTRPATTTTRPATTTTTALVP